MGKEVVQSTASLPPMVLEDLHLEEVSPTTPPSSRVGGRRRFHSPHRQNRNATRHRDGSESGSERRTGRQNHGRSDSADSSESSSSSSGTESEETRRIPTDSFGYLAYAPQYAQRETLETSDRPRSADTAGDDDDDAATLHIPPTSDVPWYLRFENDSSRSKTFSFLSTKRFWFLIEFSARMTFIAMLIPAIIINLDLPHTPFVSGSFALTSVVIAIGTNFGQTMVFFVQYMKAGFIWLPIATACVALKINRYVAVWFVVYTACLFLMAAFTEKTTRRMCLLLYNSAMVTFLTGDDNLTYPSRVLADWFLGAAFAVAATLVPYPLLATKASDRIAKSLFKITATCFTGILSCFWATSNTERTMAMVRIRHLVRSLDRLIDEFEANDIYTFYELFCETSERREARKEKVKLLLKLKMNLRSMERVVNMVQEKPQMVDESKQCQMLRNYLAISINSISRSMEALLASLSKAETYDELRSATQYFTAARRTIKALQEEFGTARKVLFYEHQDIEVVRNGRMAEFLPLLTFFVFSIANFWVSLGEFEELVNRRKPVRGWHDTLVSIWYAIRDPFIENAMLVHNLIYRRQEPELRVVLEALKVSVSMLIAVIFFRYVDNQELLLAGPAIIAFVSGTNPVEAMQASAARLSGTLIGSAVGFFAASLSTTAVDRIASLCVITFVMTFFRPGQKIGIICMYCNFVAVSSLTAAGQVAENAISRIQQNTFSIFIYCLISIAIFPVSPSRVLSEKRLAVVQGLNGTLKRLMQLVKEGADEYEKQRSKWANLAGSGGLGGRSTLVMESCDAVPIGDLQESTFLNHSNEMFGGGNLGGIQQHTLIPRAFTMAPEDTVVESIYASIFSMLDIMKETSSIMPLAADEFQIIPTEYPIRANSEIHAALHRLCALAYTITCSWKLMREKGYFSLDMLHILHNLWPVASDISRCMDCLTHVLVFYVRCPSSGLSSEVTKMATQFRVLCIELSVRKERDMVAVIQRPSTNSHGDRPQSSSEMGLHGSRRSSRSRRTHRKHISSPRRPHQRTAAPSCLVPRQSPAVYVAAVPGPSPLQPDGATADPIPPRLHRVDTRGARVTMGPVVVNMANDAPRPGGGLAPPPPPQQPPPQLVHRRQSRMEDFDSPSRTPSALQRAQSLRREAGRSRQQHRNHHHRSRSHRSKRKRNNHLSREDEQSFENADNHAPFPGPPSHSRRRTASRSSSSSRSSRRKSSGDDRSDDDWAATASDTYTADSADTPSRMNESFSVPITVEDAEGLHSLTLSLEMFGKELRRVLYAIEEIMQSS